MTDITSQRGAVVTDASEVRAALSAPEYLTAFDKAMTGGGDTLTEAERAAVERARQATGNPGPGYPPPITQED